MVPTRKKLYKIIIFIVFLPVRIKRKKKTNTATAVEQSGTEYTKAKYYFLIYFTCRTLNSVRKKMFDKIYISVMTSSKFLSLKSIVLNLLELIIATSSVNFSTYRRIVCASGPVTGIVQNIWKLMGTFSKIVCIFFA